MPETATQPVEANETVFYGPHACDECGAEIVRAELARGGQKYDIPAHLARVFHRGAESGNVDVVYPTVWAPHVCQPGRRVGEPSGD